MSDDRPQLPNRADWLTLLRMLPTAQQLALRQRLDAIYEGSMRCSFGSLCRECMSTLLQRMPLDRQRVALEQIAAAIGERP